MAFAPSAPPRIRIDLTHTVVQQVNETVAQHQQQQSMTDKSTSQPTHHNIAHNAISQLNTPTEAPVTQQNQACISLCAHV